MINDPQRHDSTASGSRIRINKDTAHMHVTLNNDFTLTLIELMTVAGITISRFTVGFKAPSGGSALCTVDQPTHH